jgi:hypothetical protein
MINEKGMSMFNNVHFRFVGMTAVFFLFALPDSVFPTPEKSPYGICAHVSRHGDHELAEGEFKLMRQAGIGWARTDFDWTTVQQAQGGPWDFSLFDATVDKAEEAGVTILPILGYDVPWASPAYRHMDLWREYVQKTVGRYKDRLPYWEVWNEPDLLQFWKETPDPANYTLLLKAAYQEIKAVNPDLKVVLGGLSGIPYDFIEGIYKAGGGAFFDVMAVHPYRYPDTPEARSLKDDLDKLRQLMANYGDSEKPVWITEIGWPTHQSRSGLLEDIVRSGLKAVNPERKQWTLAVFDDPGYPTPLNLSDKPLEAMLPGGGRIVRLNLTQMKDLTPQQYDALLWPPEEAFAVDCFDAIEAYIRDGGTVIFTQGVPLYYAARQDETGRWIRQDAGQDYRKRLHIGWEAWWTRQGVPKQSSALTVPEPFASQIRRPEQSTAAERFLTDAKLKTGDRFIPLLTAAEGDYAGTAAAVFDLNSDLKGAVIVSTLFRDFRGVPENKQAAILPRAYLIALHSGVECMFWYNLRAGETDPFYNEDNFGIIHRDLSPKPAYRTMQVLNRARPAGSKPLNNTWQTGMLFYPGWTRPDGQKAFAAWTSDAAKEISFEIEGTIAEAFDAAGKPLHIQLQNKTARIALSAAPVYLIGPENMEPVSSK